MSSLIFLFLLIPAVLFYYAVPNPQRWKLLLFYSVVFIANIGWLDTLIAFASVGLCYIGAYYITQNKNRSTLWLFVFLQLALLFFIKYGNLVHLNYYIVVAGISFYALQIIGYYIDVYRGDIELEKHICRLAFYMLFFPKLVQGPIEPAVSFLAQSYTDKSFDYNNIRKGLLRLLFGLVKKLVIADRLASMVIIAFNTNATYDSFTILLGVYLFTIQLYFDFSGYTDMALGVAQLFGYELTENFNNPLKAASIAELWRRWHISLMQWFNKYIFNPVAFALRGNGKIAIVIAIVTVFILSGLWHGIGLTYLAWALLNALCLIYEFYTRSFRQKFFSKMPFLAILITFNVFCFINIFFRISSIDNVFRLIHTLFTNWHFDWHNTVAILANGGSQKEYFNFTTYIIATLIMLLFERKIYSAIYTNRCFTLLFILFVLSILALGALNDPARFIYQQF